MSEEHVATDDLPRWVCEVVRSKSAAAVGLSLFGIGRTQITARLQTLVHGARSSVWSMNPCMTFDPSSPDQMFADRFRRTDLDHQFVTELRSVLRNPLLTSIAPWTKVAPTHLACSIIDRQVLLLAGPRTADGQCSSWITTRPDLLASALKMWARALACGRPTLVDPRCPPLSRRQVEVAYGLCLGKTDECIARGLRVSKRTVGRDVEKVLHHTNARTRTEAVRSLLGSRPVMAQPA